MPRITKHELPALEQERVIESRVGGKASLHRQRVDGIANSGEFNAIGYPKTWTSDRKPPKQTDESRAKKCDANKRTRRQVPMCEEILPQKRKHEKVTPHHELQIVPLPWRKLKQQTRNENRKRGQEKGDCLRRLLIPFEAVFPGTPAAETDQEKCQWNKDAKIIEPELKETRTPKCWIGHDPSQMRFQYRSGAEMVGS